MCQAAALPPVSIVRTSKATQAAYAVCVRGDGND